jgi:hypothetical protein
MGKIDVPPFNRKQFTLSQSSRDRQQNQRSFANIEMIQKIFDFRGR